MLYIRTGINPINVDLEQRGSSLQRLRSQYNCISVHLNRSAVHNERWRAG